MYFLNFAYHPSVDALVYLDIYISYRSDNRWRGCGATLLGCNPAVLVTAAHCVQGVSTSQELRVSCGARRMSLSQPSPLDRGEVRLAVSRVVTHPQYRESLLALSHGVKLFRCQCPFPAITEQLLVRFVHDIAVIMLEEGQLPCAK